MTDLEISKKLGRNIGYVAARRQTLGLWIDKAPKALKKPLEYSRKVRGYSLETGKTYKVESNKYYKCLKDYAEFILFECINTGLKESFLKVDLVEMGVR